jgi:gliding motility-associated-like protein
MRYLYFFCFFIATVFASGAPNKSVQFIRNEGQWEASILFKAEIPGGYMLVKRTGIQYVFFDTRALAALHAGGIVDEKGARVAPGPIKGHAFEMTFQEANLSPAVGTAGKSNAVYNYFIGNDPAKWRGGVSAYDEIYLKDIYPGIDFRLYSSDQSLKYEYIARPKADVSKISMKYVGLDELSMLDKKLSYRTSVNTATEFEPYSFQVIGGKTIEVKSGFKLRNHEVQFEFPEKYDASQPLTIDPELVFSTYSGSKSDNWAQTATYDADGNLFAGGSVFGGDFPVTNGAFQVKGDAGSMANGMNNPKGYGITDVVIMKLGGNGNQLIYATFLGGDASDVPHSLIANSKGELVIFGTTASGNFPTTAASYQKKHAGGSLFGVYGSATTADEDPNFTGIGFERGSDIFVAVLSKDGRNLVGSTYLGGKANDGFNDTRALIIKNYGDEFRGEVMVDKNDNIYLASITASTDFPLVNASQTTKSAGYDAVVCKLNPTCSQLLWSTYLGGNNFDGAYGIKVDEAGKVYVCGQTFSSNLPATTGVYGQTYSGSGDGFIARFSTSGTFEQLTYMGTTEADANFFLEIDHEDNVYVFGLTQGSYPVSAGVYRNANSGQFVHCLDKNLSKTIFSTVVGTGRGRGRIDIVPTAFLVNDCGNIYLAGWGGKVNSSASKNLNRFSTTTGLPVTQDAYQATTTGSNFYLMILEKNAQSLLYATYFGSAAPKDASGEVGDHVDGGTCRFDKNGYIYHSACACLSRGEDHIATFPIKNAYQPQHQSSNCNMAAFKFSIDDLKADFEIKNEANRPVTEICAPAKINFYNLSKGARTYEWTINGDVITRTKDMLLFNFTAPGTYTIKLRIFNKITCRTTDSTIRTFLVKGFVAKARGDTLVCPNSPVQLFADGGEKYTWSPATGLNNAGIANPVAKAASTTKYTVAIEKEGCTITKDVTIKVDDSKSDFLVSPDTAICKGQNILLKATGNGTRFIWTGTDIPETPGTSITVTPVRTSTYTVSCEYPDGCKPTRSVTVKIDESFQPDFDYSITRDCTRPYELTFTNKTRNATSFKWSMGNADTLNSLVPQNYRYSKSGTFQVTLKAYNQTGCELSVTKSIDVPENDGKVPNVITPNNDGKNDQFVTGFKDVTIDIYNRYGKLIYESKDYQNDWGKDIPSGTYYYIFTTPAGSTCKGWVTVID